MLHVLERAQESTLLDEVLVATDNARIAEVVRAAGGRVMLTSGTHRCGTDRVWEAASTRDHAVIVNIQGDQPLLDPAAVDACIQGLRSSGADMATLAAEQVPFDAPSSVVRVVTDPQNFAVAFSRKHVSKTEIHRHHVGVYAFQRQALEAFANRAPSSGEIRESLEQLRVLEYGGKVKVVLVEQAAPSVDRPEDLRAVEAWKS